MSGVVETGIVRIAAVRAEGTTNGQGTGFALVPVGLAHADITDHVDRTAFAVAATMLALGRPVYYSPFLKAISTDGTFGMFSVKSPDFEQLGPLDVVQAEALWYLVRKSGRLILMLEGGPVDILDMPDAESFLGWLQMIESGCAVLFDGVSLSTPAPFRWNCEELR